MPKRPDDAPDLGVGGKAKAQKAEAARAKEAAAHAKKAAAEDASWADGANSRALGKKAAEEEKRAEAEKRRREAEELLRKEEADAASQRLRGAEKVAARRAVEGSRKADERDRLAAPSLEARSIDAAIAVLSVATGEMALKGGAGAGDDGADAHAADVAAAAKLTKKLATGVDEDNMNAKTAFKRFEERILPELKEEYPTLRRSQLNEMVFRKWERSEENPIRQARLQGNK